MKIVVVFDYTNQLIEQFKKYKIGCLFVNVFTYKQLMRAMELKPNLVILKDEFYPVKTKILAINKLPDFNVNAFVSEPLNYKHIASIIKTLIN